MSIEVEDRTDEMQASISAAREWIRARPKSVQDLLLRFPPCSVVRIIPSSEAHYSIPLRGTYGLVVSYFENGHLGVMQLPDGTDRNAMLVKLFDAQLGACGQVCAEVMEIVRTQGPYTVEFVQDALTSSQ
jgi:hypothetical protein